MEWIKLSTDIFDDEKIKIIMAEKRGNELVLCWIKLLCLAGKQENMGVFSINGKALTAEQIATVTGTEKGLMNRAVDAFVEYGMLLNDNGFLSIPKWEAHQDIEKAEEHRAAAARRQAAFRQRQKSRHSNVTSNVTDNVTATDEKRYSNAAEEEKELRNNINIVSLEREKELYETESERARARTRDDNSCDLGYFGFESFWAAYPKHEAEDAARHEWLKILPSAELSREIIASVKAWRNSDEWKREDGRFIPRAAKWLSEHRWKDQFTVVGVMR